MVFSQLHYHGLKYDLDYLPVQMGKNEKNNQIKCFLENLYYLSGDSWAHRKSGVQMLTGFKEPAKKEQTHLCL